MPPVGFKQLVADALPGTIGKLLKQTGLVESTIRRWLRALRGEGKAHIGAWQRRHGRFSPVWVAGPGKDAPQPKPYTTAQMCKRWRKKRAKERAEHESTKREALAYADQAEQHGDPLVLALFRKSPQTRPTA